MNLNEALQILATVSGDDESYHARFDEIIEQRLMELDPEFMKALKEEYDKSGNQRWCA